MKNLLYILRALFVISFAIKIGLMVRLLRLWMNKRHIKPKKTEILPDNNFIFTNAEYEVVENNADYQELENIFQRSL